MGHDLDPDPADQNQCGSKRIQIQYTVKKISDFPIPSRVVTNQTLPGREKLRKSPTFFSSVYWFYGAGQQ